MERVPLVSAIVPAYNYGNYLARALDSALAQDWPACEVIVVDDGSTDDTPEVIASYGDRIRAVRRSNGGLNAAISTGIDHARGDFLTFLDADDIWRSDRVRLLAEALIAKPQAGLVYGDMEIIDDDERVTHPSFRRAYGIEPLSGRVLGRLLRGNFISAGSLMVRASLRDRYHPIPEVAAWQDWWIVSRVAEVADVEPIAAPVNLYRAHGANMNLGSDAARMVELLRTEIPFRRWLLTSVPADVATPGEWIAAVQALDSSLAAVGRADGVPPLTLAPVTQDDQERADRTLAAARHALEKADPATAVAHLAGAFASVPGRPEPRALLTEVAPLAQAQAAGTADPAPAVRRFVAFAVAEDLLADPQLLVAYGQTFGGADDVTLVVGGADDPAVIARLSALVDEAGMSSEDAADILALDARHPAVAAALIGRPVDEHLVAGVDLDALRARASAAAAA